MIELVKSGSPSRNESIGELMPMVRRIARGLTRVLHSADFDEYVQDGTLGAILAVDAFDPERGVPLTLYARPIITGAILNGVRARNPIPQSARQRLNRAEEARYQKAVTGHELEPWSQLEDRTPLLKEARIIANRASGMSLDSAEAPASALADRLADPGTIVEEREVAADLLNRIARLPKRLRDVIRMNYFEQRSLTEIAPLMGVTPQRVSQIRTAALTELRRSLR